MFKKVIYRSIFSFLFFFFLIIVFFFFNNSYIGEIYDYTLAIEHLSRLKGSLSSGKNNSGAIIDLVYFMWELSQILFGKRYLSLTYMNLFITLFTYTGLSLLLFRFINLPKAAFFSFVIVLCCLMQHTIPWYNSLASVVSIFMPFYCVSLLNNKINVGGVLFLFILILISSMTKFNFHASNLLVLSFLLFRFLFYKKNASLIKTSFCISFFSIIYFFIPIFILSLINDLTINEWNNNHLGGYVYSVAKIFYAKWFQDPYLFLVFFNNFFPNNFSIGILIIGPIFILTIFYKIKDAFKEEHFAWAYPFIFIVAGYMVVLPHDGHTLVTGIVFLAYSFILLLASVDRISNVHYGKIILPCTYFLLIGLLCFANRSRLTYALNGYSIFNVKTELFNNLSVELNPFMLGVNLDQIVFNRINDILLNLKKRGITIENNDVFWGPGLNVFNMTLNKKHKLNTPLSFAGNHTENIDLQVLKEAIKNNNYKVFVFDNKWKWAFPTSFNDYLETNYKKISSDNGTIFIEKTLY